MPAWWMEPGGISRRACGICACNSAIPTGNFLLSWPSASPASAIPAATTYQAAETRLEIQKGKAIGPRIVASGPAVGGNQTAQTARLAFDRLFEDSVDFIQILPDLSREAYLALAEQARHWRLRFDGAVPADVSPLEAVNARQGIIEGLSNLGPLTDDTVIRFFEKCAMFGTRISPAPEPGRSLHQAVPAHRAGQALQSGAAGGDGQRRCRTPPPAEICRTS